MRKVLLALSALLPGAIGGCAAGYGYGGGVYAGGPYAYDGYYDGFYGPIYDGYWGNDGFFYYRHGVGERRFIRGDRAHFSRGPNGGAGFQHFGGNFNRGPGMHTPHFGGGGFHGGGHAGGAHGGHR